MVVVVVVELEITKNLDILVLQISLLHQQQMHGVRLVHQQKAMEANVEEPVINNTNKNINSNSNNSNNSNNNNHHNTEEMHRAS